MGAIVLLLVFAVSWVAAWSLVRPSVRATRVGGALETFAIWQTFTIVLLYSLGLTSTLNRWTVGGTLVAAGGFLCALKLRDPALRDDLRTHLSALARIPVDAFRELQSGNALLLLPLLGAAGVLGWCLLSAWFLPPKNLWDGMWYHDTIVGFTIQNQGFAVVDLPRTTQAVNGVPRSVNVMETFAAIFGGRRLVELPNVLSMAMGALGVFAIARRFGARVAIAITAGCLYVLMPGNTRLSTATMVDPYSAMVTVVAAYFVLKRELSGRDIVLAGGLTAVLVGSKYVALVPAGMLMLVLFGRVAAATLRQKSARLLAPLVLASVLVLGMMATTFVRNQMHFDNPIWPHGAEVESLGIDWKPSESKTRVGAGKETSVWEQVKLFIAIPHTTKMPHFHTTGTHDYGMAVNWVLLPAGLLTTVWLIIAWLLGRFGRREPDDDIGALLLLALIAWTQLLLFPPIWAARYQLGAMALVFAIVAWLSSRSTRQTEVTGLFVVAGVLACINIAWSAQKKTLPPAKWMWQGITNPSELVDIDERAGAPVRRVIAVHREKLGPDDLTVYDSMTFPSLLFNNRYDNRVAYVPKKGFLDRAEELGATWIYVRHKSVQRAAKSDPRWERVGILESVRRTRRGIVFRYVGESKPGR